MNICLQQNKIDFRLVEDLTASYDKPPKATKSKKR